MKKKKNCSHEDTYTMFNQLARRGKTNARMLQRIVKLLQNLFLLFFFFSADDKPTLRYLVLRF